MGSEHDAATRGAAYCREVITQPSEEHMTDKFDMRIPLVSTGLAIALTAYSTLKPPRNSEATRETLMGLVIVALISVLAFFLGIFSVALAGAAMMIALEARRRVSSPRAATAALVISAITVV